MNDQLLDDNLENTAPFDQEKLKEVKTARNEAHKLISLVREGRVLFIVLALIALVFAVLGYYRWQNEQEEGIPFLLEGGFLFVIYAGCALFYKKNPKIVLIVGFGVYLFFFIVGIVLDPESMFSNFIMRGFIIYYFIKTIKATMNLPAALEVLKKLGVPSHWFDLAKNLQDLPLSKTLKN